MKIYNCIVQTEWKNNPYIQRLDIRATNPREAIKEIMNLQKVAKEIVVPAQRIIMIAVRDEGEEEPLKAVFLRDEPRKDEYINATITRENEGNYISF